MATEVASTGKACPLIPGLHSDAGAAPSSGIAPAAKGSPSRAGHAPSALTLTTAEGRWTVSGGAGGRLGTVTSLSPAARKFSAATT